MAKSPSPFDDMPPSVGDTFVGEITAMRSRGDYVVVTVSAKGGWLTPRRDWEVSGYTWGIMPRAGWGNIPFDDNEQVTSLDALRQRLSALQVRWLVGNEYAQAKELFEKQ